MLWLGTLRDLLLLRTRGFEALRNGRSVPRGLAIIVAVALFASLPSFIADLQKGLSYHAASEGEAAQQQAQLNQLQESLAPFLKSLPVPAQEQLDAQVRSGMQLGLDIARGVEALPTPLPRPTNQLFHAVARWLEKPLQGTLIPLAGASLATWLAYGIWVMLSARLLKGQANLAEFFGLTSAFALPHVLGVLNPVPVVGVIAGLLAWLWGLLIYVKATAVSQSLSLERAILALLMPVLAILALALIVFLVLFISLGASGLLSGVR
jgi:hypothetical protein